MLTPPTAILLDLDGTLCDTDASVQAGINGACEEAGRILNVDESRWLAANAEAAGIEWSANAALWISGELSPLDLSLRIYERTLLAVGADPALALTFVNAHARAAELALHTYKDVSEFIDAAVERGIKLGLVTNGASATQRKTLEVLSLVQTFGAVVVSSECGVSKPNPAIFELALGALEADPTHAWHVGDSLESDVAGALSAGVAAVWVNRLGNKIPTSGPVPTIQIDSLTELISRLG